jgi:hypothetical protein
MKRNTEDEYEGLDPETFRPFRRCGARPGQAHHESCALPISDVAVRIALDATKNRWQVGVSRRLGCTYSLTRDGISMVDAEGKGTLRDFVSLIQELPEILNRLAGR